MSAKKKVLLSTSPVKIVAIDAGHGGVDPGTLNNGVIERKVTLDVAQRVGRILADNGVKVVYTRKGNRTVSLARRTEIANASGVDLFVSVHVNAHLDKSVHGLEVYYFNGADRAQTLAVKGARNKKQRVRKVVLTERMLESHKLARDISRQMSRKARAGGFHVVSKGIKNAPFHVLTSTSMPAVLAEIGYCTNASEAKRILDPSYRQAIAEGIASGILAYRDRAGGRLTAERRTATTLQ